jgi:hypothetical protein
MMLEEEVKLYSSPVSRQNSFLPRLAATARRWWPPIRVWSSVALAIISPASSTMIFMCRLQSNAPISAAAMVRNLSNLVRVPGVPPHEDHGFRMTGATYKHRLCVPICINLGRCKKLQRYLRVGVARQATGASGLSVEAVGRPYGAAGTAYKGTLYGHHFPFCPLRQSVT